MQSHAKTKHTQGERGGNKLELEIEKEITSSLLDKGTHFNFVHPAQS